MSRAGALLLLFALGACDTRLVASDFDQTCAESPDCVVVLEGELCGACGPALTPAAIARSEAERYQAARAAVRCPPRLGPLPPCAPPDDAPSPPLEAVCSAGRCEARPQ